MKPPKKRARPRHLEDADMVHLFAWLRLTRYGCRPIADYAWHTPNGGKRNAREAARLKAMGVKRGVPDVFVAIPRGDCPGLFVELKAGRNTATDAQAAMLSLLASQGFAVGVVRGWVDAANFIADYLGLPGVDGATQ